MNENAFFHWLKKVFVPSLPSAAEREYVILLLDGHSSHQLYHTSVFGEKNKVVLFCLPPHTSHMLQPLDKVFWTI